MQRNNTNWNVSQLVRYIDNGKATFDNPIQRGVVWDVYRKSLLIHSILYGYPIPAMYFKHIPVPSAVDTKKKKRISPDIYDNFDGKQRSMAIYDFVKDGFRLVDHQDITPVMNDDGELEDVRALCFSELPEWAQDRIKSFSLTVYYFDNMSDEEIREYFRRLNNGKSLTSIEITRVQTPNLACFQKLAQHSAIQFITTNAAKKGFMDENTAMQIYNLVAEDAPDFSTKGFRQWAKNIEPKEEILSDITRSLDILYEFMTTCEDKQLLKTMKKRTHFVSCTYACYFGLKNGKTKEYLYHVLSRFFSSPAEEYNRVVGSASAKSTSIQVRRCIMEEVVQGEYDDYSAEKQSGDPSPNEFKGNSQWTDIPESRLVIEPIENASFL